MIRLATQFDAPGTRAAEAAIPGGCCSCCCCCCCLATSVSVSAVAAIQASRKASSAPDRPAYASFWVALAGASLVAGAILAGGIAWAASGFNSSSTLPIVLFGTVAFWGALLWAAFRGVGFKNPVVRVVAFVLIGVVAFAIEAFIAAFVVLSFWPGYLLLAASVIGSVLWLATGPHGPRPSSDSSAQQ